MASATAVSPFGARLRQWRAVRGLRQLALATEAGTTARHVSFLETGRSRPSRAMVLRISDVLSLPLRERNRLLEAAGLAAAYPQAGLESETLAPFRSAIARLLGAHEPYPALVFDDRYTVVDANAAAVALFGSDVVGGNLIRRYTDPAARAAIRNWPEVAHAGLARIRERARQAPHDEQLAALVGIAEAAVADLPPGNPSDDGLIACPEFLAGDHVIRTIAMAARFDSVLEVTLDELRIELLYPADDVAEQFFRTRRASRRWES
jgi:transcriptional regulator with XRE-family HTH domain